MTVSSQAATAARGSSTVAPPSITAGVRRVSKVRVPMKLSNVYVVPQIAARLF